MHTPRIEDLFAESIALTTIMDGAPLGLTVVDRDRRVVVINRTLEVLCGFKQEEAAGLPCACIVRNNVCVHQCPVQKVLETNEPMVVEGDIINKERQKIPVRITVSPITDGKGRVVGFLEAVEDIRLLKKLSGGMTRAYGFGRLIGRSPQVERIFSILPAIAETDSSVLITGETGTGKDLLAEAIHQSSSRAKGPFVKVNCGALPETLLESELFGHQKGAFTGAVDNKPGRFRLAHTGTLYLTEIGDLPLALQVKLLTFLDDKIIYPLGSTKGAPVDVRVVAATHRNLEQMVREHRFREDLLFRLNVIRIPVPPLRDRGDDVRLLLDHFLHAYTEQFKRPMKRLSKEALKLLLEYGYPGNVRELRNIVEYAVNICPQDRIEIEHLPAYLTEQPVSAPGPEPLEQEGDLLRVDTADAAVGSTATWAGIERKMILDALLKAKGKRSRAAELLGWGRSTLWRKMKQYGIDG